LQREYENHLEEMINNKDEKIRKKGLALKATYEKLQQSDITFHVVKSNPRDDSSGELTYKGEQGHVYVNLKGDSHATGALSAIQKIAHEFKHGEQFLDGDIGFIRNEKGKWGGLNDDLPDEADAFIAGFSAQPLDPSQTTGDSGEFLKSINMAMLYGRDAVVNALGRKGPYIGRSPKAFGMNFSGGKVPPNVYAIPKK
jgi:hypothetical protein